MKLIHKNRQYLFDGFEEDIHNDYPYRIQRKESSRVINILDILKNRFEDLTNLIDEKQFTQIVTELQLENYDSISVSYYIKNLNLFYLIDENELFIFSYGEKQPARYQLILEAIYSIK